MMTLDSIIRRGAHTHPNRVAIVDQTGQSWTWNEFDRHVSRTAITLRSLGIRAGDRVAAVAENSIDYFALYYGAARVAATLCPMNYLNTSSELEYLMVHFDPAIVLAEPRYHEKVAGAVKAASAAARVFSFGTDNTEWGRLLSGADFDYPSTDVDPDSTHLVLYTSGTTGRPKGVCHSQRAHFVDAYYAALGFGVESTDRYLVHAPSFHCACWDHAKMFFAADASIRILARFDASAALEAIERDNITALFGVPAVLRALLSHPQWPTRDLSSLRILYYGGALGELDVLHDLPNSLSQDVSIAQIYGLTEAGPFVAVSPPWLARRNPIPIGFAVPGVELRLRDPDNGTWTIDGNVGEIVVRSASLIKEYWRDPEATLNAIRDGWLHTGDLARRDDQGAYHIVDRLKDMIRSGGENIYAAEVERAVLMHPLVQEVAVIGLPDARWDERVVAVVRLVDGACLDQEALQAFCRDHLAGYKVPKQMEFVGDFPRTGLGKIAKHHLRKSLQTHG